MIMDVDRVIDTSLLHFPEEVKSRFAFLERLGFRRVRPKATLVRYESLVMGINVYHGGRSYEIGIEIEPVQGPATAVISGNLFQRRMAVCSLLISLSPRTLSGATQQKTFKASVSRQLARRRLHRSD